MRKRVYLCKSYLASERQYKAALAKLGEFDLEIVEWTGGTKPSESEFQREMDKISSCDLCVILPPHGVNAGDNFTVGKGVFSAYRQFVSTSEIPHHFEDPDDPDESLYIDGELGTEPVLVMIGETFHCSYGYCKIPGGDWKNNYCSIDVVSSKESNIGTIIKNLPEKSLSSYLFTENYQLLAVAKYLNLI